MNAYRMDGRTVEEFQRDIKRGNDREAKAIKLFKTYLEREFNFTGEIQENGCDMTGAYIEDINKVSMEADYTIGANKLEVKTSAVHSSTIYIKVSQVKSYIKQQASLLYVNGIERMTPAFTFFTVEDLKNFESTYPSVTPPNRINGGKLSFEIKCTDLYWSTFEGKEKVYE